MTIGWRVVFLGAFILVSATVHSGGDDFLLDLSLFSWGLICWLESGRRLKLFVFYLAGFGAMCGLIKFNLLVNAGLTITLLAGDLALRGRRGLAALTVAAFVLGWLAGWMLLGQRLSHLGVFFANSLAITAGYNQTVSLEFTIGRGIAAGGAGFRGGHDSRERGVAFRRGTPPAQAGIAHGLAGRLFLPAMEAWFRARRSNARFLLPRRCVAGGAGFGGGAAHGATNGIMGACYRSWSLPGCALPVLCMTPGFLGIAVRLAPERAAQNLGVLLRPGKYLRDQSKAYSLEQSGSQLPKLRGLIGRGTTDVFGQIQMYALFNELNYRPRPVFQSYSTFNRRLMELNSRFYNLQQRPGIRVVHPAGD